MSNTTESNPHKSKHASLLNDLYAMSESFAYAARKQVLREAERLIVDQEREIDRLRAYMKEMQKEISQAARDAYSEGQWQARQGEDYGSY